MSKRPPPSRDRSAHKRAGNKPGPRKHGGPRPASPSEGRRPTHKSTSKPDGLWLYGRHAVAAALENPVRKIRRVMMTSDTKEALDQAQAETVSRADLDDLLTHIDPGAVHQGVAMQTAPLPQPALEDVLERLATATPARLVVLDQVTDPRNIGAVLRSASAFGAAAVILTDRGAPEETGAMAKAASGALENVPMISVVNLQRTFDTLRGSGFWMVGLEGEAADDLPDAKLPDRVALVLGAEGRGLRRLTAEACDFRVRLPMNPEMESLNVSNAAAIALYDLYCRARR